MTNYVTVKLPKNLAEQIDYVIEQQNLGCVSRAEFVKDAARRYLAAMKQDTNQ
jgi:metal-responsive CopG/Arc/MetJ family transcriptional regulator